MNLVSKTKYLIWNIAVLASLVSYSNLTPQSGYSLQFKTEILASATAKTKNDRIGYFAATPVRLLKLNNWSSVQQNYALKNKVSFRAQVLKNHIRVAPFSIIWHKPNRAKITEEEPNFLFG